MRLARRLRRLVPALLAGLVLLVSLMGAAHAHGAGAVGDAAALAAAPLHEARATTGELDCALCTAASRLAHAACAASPLALDSALERFQPPASDTALQRAPLWRSQSRAPPRLG